MLIIVGHGPSILCGLGSFIDQNTVVRLKHGKVKAQPAEHFGTRTDYLCGRSHVYAQDGVPFWQYSDDSKWGEYYRGFNPKYFKPSHGLCAVFCAIDHLSPEEIGVIGFDRILNPGDITTDKWNKLDKPAYPWTHDQRAENECLHSLGVRIIDLAKEYGSTVRL